jgi:hypothetical protein
MSALQYAFAHCDDRLDIISTSRNLLGLSCVLDAHKAKVMSDLKDLLGLITIILASYAPSKKTRESELIGASKHLEKKPSVSCCRRLRYATVQTSLS